MEIKTKFNIGDKVWTLHENKIVKFTINQIEANVYDDEILIKYGSKERIKQTVSWSIFQQELSISKKESELFSAKEELINSL